MNRTKHTALALLLALCFTLGLLPALTPTARAAGVNYLYYASEADAIAGKTTSGTAEATSVTASDTAWGSADSTTWYVVDSTLENTNRITVTGDVHLILADDKTLTASAGGISVLDGNSLTIYAQSTGDGMGALAAITSADYYAGIGSGNGTDTGNVAAGTITINGGAVTANGGGQGAGIGGGCQGAGGTITVNGGTVQANGGSQGAGIGGGYQGAGGTITVNGGTVEANSGYQGAGIGGGDQGAGGTITVNGGTVQAHGSISGAGIGGGYQGAGGTITVNGGAVTATGGPGGAGIGGGSNGAGGTITVNGGAVTATGGNHGAGIGGSENGACGAISITGGAVNATGKDGGAGIGGGDSGNNSGADNSISITGGTVTATVPNGTTGAAIGIGGGDSGTDVTVTISAGATVMAGTDASGAGASVVTNVANNTSYKYAKITFAPAAPSYTVTAADTVTTEKKYHYGDEFTIAVTVSGADFEGGEFTLTYDKDMFQLTAETVAPDKNDDKAINAATGNKFNADSDGKYAFSLNNRIKFTNGDAIVHLNFKVTGKATKETAFDFAFDEDNPPKICYDTDKDSVAATAAKGSVTLEPILYAVTLTPSPSGGFTLTGDNGVADVENGNAIDGQPYVVTIVGYDADNYSYDVALKVGGTDVASPPQPDSEGKITLAANSFGGDIEMTVTRTLANFTVDVVHDYVSGWTLVTVAKTDANKGTSDYKYDGNAMYYVEAYKAYAYLVKKPDNAADALTTETATAKVSLGTSAAATIAKGYDVNNTGKVDYSDALLTYRCYLVADKAPDTSMETYLRADVDASKKVDTMDVSAIDANRTTQEAPEGK